MGKTPPPTPHPRTAESWVNGTKVSLQWKLQTTCRGPTGSQSSEHLDVMTPKNIHDPNLA